MRHLRKYLVVYGGLTFYAILAGIPIYWMIITTFKPDRDLYNLQNFPLWFNQNGITLDHLGLLFNRTGFTTWLKSTLWVPVGVFGITLLVSVRACYWLALLRLRCAGSLT